MTISYEPTGALDFWNLFVVNTFGSFWLAVIGIAILLFLLMCVLGRVSIYTGTWYLLMFIDVMTLGYGYVIINIIVTVLLLIATFFSILNYFNSPK